MATSAAEVPQTRPGSGNLIGYLPRKDLPSSLALLPPPRRPTLRWRRRLPNCTPIRCSRRKWPRPGPRWLRLAAKVANLHLTARQRPPRSNSSGRKVQAKNLLSRSHAARRPDARQTPCSCRDLGDPVHVPGKHGCNGKLILTSQSDAIGIAARDSLIGFGRRKESKRALIMQGKNASNAHGHHSHHRSHPA